MPQTITLSEPDERQFASAHQERVAGPLALVGGFLRKVAENTFGFDYRSLAITRIGLGACVLWLALTHGWELRAFYTDEGVLPRSVMERYGGTTGISLHLANGGHTYITVLFVMQALFACMMIAGYRTRLATVGAYFLLLSMQNRHPILIFGADIALRVCLFWAMFLPLSKRFSIDSLASAKPPPVRPYLGVAGLAFIFQVCIIYIGGALMKIGPSWQVDHTAVEQALAIDAYSRPLGVWLRQYKDVTRWLTISTYYLELYGPLLFVFPLLLKTRHMTSKWGYLLTSFARMLGIVLFAGMQISFGLCMTMGIFGLVMITVTLAFLPAPFWDWIAEPLARWVARKFRWLGSISTTWLGKLWRHWIKRERSWSRRSLALTQLPGMRLARIGLALARDSALALLLWCVIIWNLDNLPDSNVQLEPKLVTLTSNVGLNQLWDMFAPDPQTDDGWFVVAGALRNGQTVDLMSGQMPVSFSKPASVSGSYRNSVWMSYLISFWSEGASSPEHFARYMAMVWNETHTGEEQIQQIEIHMMRETAEPGWPEKTVTQVPVWTQWF